MPSSSDWLASLLVSLQQSGVQGEIAANYIRLHKVRLDLHTQTTGARWGLGRRIDLHPRYLEGAPDATYPLSLLVHEVRHLQQGPLTALSVYGELEAWQLQFNFIFDRTGHYHDLPALQQIIQELMSLRGGWDRTALAEARGLMRRYAGERYRIDLLPLFPLPAEIAWLLTRRQPKSFAR